MKAATLANPNDERGLIGCVIQDAKQVVHELLHQYPTPAVLFHDDRHAEIFAAAEALVDEGATVDTAILFSRLKTTSKNTFTMGDLLEIEEAAPSPLNWSYYAKPLFELHQRRQLMAITATATRSVHDQDHDFAQTLEDVSQGIADIAVTGRNSAGTKDYVLATIDRWEEAAKNSGKLPGLASSFFQLDNITRGFRQGQMIVLAARPGRGKTALAMTIATHQAVRVGNAVGIFSMEMSGEELVGRAICGLAGVPMDIADRGKLNADNLNKITTASTKIGKAPLIIDDTGGLTVAQLRARARRMVLHQKVKLIIVDYLQLIRSQNPRASRYETVTEVSAAVKQIAKDLKVPVIALAQLNRDIEKDKREPQLSDLRDSGGIEQDADIVGMLHWENLEEEDTKLTRLLIRKHRNGRMGGVDLVFHRPTTTFESRRPDQ